MLFYKLFLETQVINIGFPADAVYVSCRENTKQDPNLNPEASELTIIVFLLVSNCKSIHPIDVL